MKFTRSLIALAIVSLFALALPARAQLTPTTVTDSISNIITCTLTSTNVVNAKEITLRQGKGVAIAPYFVGTQSTNTGVIAFFFAVSVDGSNYSTTTIRAASTANATTAVRDYILIPPSTLDNARKIKLLTITNALANMASLTVSNLHISIAN